MLPFALTIFLSAFLLFQVQPIIARYILPWYGGSPAVWTTCMLFFQCALVLGYAYSDGVVRRLGHRRQVVVHLVLLVLSLFLLPIIPDDSLKWKPGADPAISILWLLALTIGANYMLLATTGPLLQSWFSRAFPGKSPNRLFALSNFGSLLALLGYPVLFETTMRLKNQAYVWSGGYVVFVACCLWAGVQVWKAPAEAAPLFPESNVDGRREFGWRRVVAWLVFSMIPSVLLLAITNEISQEVAVVPMLWIAPLSLYLISFIICFERPAWYRRDVFGVLLLVSAFGAGACLLNPTGIHFVYQFLIYCLLQFSASMTLHGELALLKPGSRHLTIFYLMLAIGGALGGVAVVAIAPLMFNGFYELQVAIVVAVFLTAIRWWQVRDHQSIWHVSVAMAILLSIGIAVWSIHQRLNINANQALRMAIVLSVWFLLLWMFGLSQWWRLNLTIRSDAGNAKSRGGLASVFWMAVLASVYGVSLLLITMPDWFKAWSGLAVLCVVFLVWFVTLGTLNQPPVRLRVYSGLALGYLFFVCQISFAIVGMINDAPDEDQTVTARRVLEVRRNFFGLSSVDEVKTTFNGTFREIVNGRIGHGRQYLDDDWRMRASMYYGPRSGIGLAFAEHPKRRAGEPMKIGVIGLGTGTLAALANEQDSVVYYEINPAVIELCDKYFTYLQESPAQCEVPRLGDARILMEQAMAKRESEGFDLLIVDAFSSDSIPRHLLTREAMAVYDAHLSEGGILAIHVSNWFLELRPVVFALAEAAGYRAVNIYDSSEDYRTNPELSRFHFSNWMLVTKNESFLGSEALVPHVDEFDPDLRVLWSDDFGSVLQVLRLDRPDFWPKSWWPFIDD
ncbi:MAG: fused MFS/spermidine synthase [Pirellulaceae bacterium]